MGVYRTKFKQKWELEYAAWKRQQDAKTATSVDKAVTDIEQYIYQGPFFEPTGPGIIQTKETASPQQTEADTRQAEWDRVNREYQARKLNIKEQEPMVEARYYEPEVGVKGRIVPREIKPIVQPVIRDTVQKVAVGARIKKTPIVKFKGMKLSEEGAIAQIAQREAELEKARSDWEKPYLEFRETQRLAFEEARKQLDIPNPDIEFAKEWVTKNFPQADVREKLSRELEYYGTHHFSGASDLKINIRKREIQSELDKLPTVEPETAESHYLKYKERKQQLKLAGAKTYYRP